MDLQQKTKRSNSFTTATKSLDRILNSLGATPLEHLNQSHLRDIMRKVNEDILFLEEKISLISNSPSKNPIILKTYENMLDSRKMVLSWCEQRPLKKQNPA